MAKSAMRISSAEKRVIKGSRATPVLDDGNSSFT